MKAEVAGLLTHVVALLRETQGDRAAIQSLLHAAVEIAYVQDWDAAQLGCEAARIFLCVPDAEPSKGA